MGFVVKHKLEGKRGKFYVTLNEEEALLEYEVTNNIIIAYHTFTPLNLRGKGIALAMTKALIELAQKDGRKIRPLCSYVANYLKNQPELSTLIDNTL